MIIIEEYRVKNDGSHIFYIFGKLNLNVRRYIFLKIRDMHPMFLVNKTPDIWAFIMINFTYLGNNLQ